MGQAAGVLDEVLSWPIKRAVPASASDESGSLAGCHLPSLETQLGTSSSKVLNLPTLDQLVQPGLGTLPLPPHNKPCCFLRHKPTTIPRPASPRLQLHSFPQASIWAAAAPTIQWLPTAVRVPLFSHPDGRTLRNLSGLLLGFVPLRSLSTGATRPALLRTPCANTNPRGDRRSRRRVRLRRRPGTSQVV